VWVETSTNIHHSHRHQFSIIPSSGSAFGTIARGHPKALNLTAHIDITFDNGRRKRMVVGLERRSAARASITATVSSVVSVLSDNEAIVSSESTTTTTTTATTTAATATVVALPSDSSSTTRHGAVDSSSTLSDGLTPATKVTIGVGIVGTGVALCAGVTALLVVLMRRRRAQPANAINAWKSQQNSKHCV
jgi:hypothetical protein